MTERILIFAVITILVGLIAFSGIAGPATVLAKTVFFLFLILFLILVIGNVLWKRPPRY
ncbi:MAG: DUF1328 domain-containing protein [Desulfocapsaceae bacterium]|jgi:uncharacterized membrane protein YtjA (UPF0391 family)|nr:DUF1328 domain-containing protein [Desulfocapsaceae bacterium]